MVFPFFLVQKYLHEEHLTVLNMAKASFADGVVPKAGIFDQGREALGFHHYAPRTEEAYLPQ